MNDDENSDHEIARPIRIDGAVDVNLPNTEITLRGENTPAIREDALWLLIRTSSRRLSFDNYHKFLRRFCECCEFGAIGPDCPDDGSPNFAFGTQSYQTLKTATEAFLLANAIVVPKTLDDLRVAEWMKGCKVDSADGGDDVPKEWQEKEGAAFAQDLTRAPGFEDAHLQAFRESLTTICGKEVLPHLGALFEALDVRGILQNNADLCGGEGKPVWCSPVIVPRLTGPLGIELIWNYWLEEARLVQGFNAVLRRFKNIRSSQGADPLARLETSPLAPLNNLLWGFAQDRPNQLTVERRAYEYAHEYGLLVTTRPRKGWQPADVRTDFLRAFHTVLRRAMEYFADADDRTRDADAFRLLTAIGDIHRILGEGAHNQYGDMPWQARVEMLTQQYMLADPHMERFLGGRLGVPYRERWNGTLDTLRDLFKWGPTRTGSFNTLATNGEQLLLSLRYGPWADTNAGVAASWARFWREEIQEYVHAYQSVTDVELSAPRREVQTKGISDEQPSALIAARKRS